MATTAMMDQIVTRPMSVAMHLPPKPRRAIPAPHAPVSASQYTGIPRRFASTAGFLPTAGLAVRTFFSEICRGVAKGTHTATGCRYDGQNICTQILFRLSGVRSPGAAHPRWQLPSARSVRSAAVPTPGLSAAPNRSRSCISAARIAVARRWARPSDARVLTSLWFAIRGAGCRVDFTVGAQRQAGVGRAGLSKIGRVVPCRHTYLPRQPPRPLP
jgi:hypothetical protein